MDVTRENKLRMFEAFEATFEITDRFSSILVGMTAKK